MSSNHNDSNLGRTKLIKIMIILIHLRNSWFLNFTTFSMFSLSLLSAHFNFLTNFCQSFPYFLLIFTAILFLLFVFFCCFFQLNYLISVPFNEKFTYFRLQFSLIFYVLLSLFFVFFSFLFFAFSLFFLLVFRFFVMENALTGLFFPIPS